MKIILKIITISITAFVLLSCAGGGTAQKADSGSSSAKGVTLDEAITDASSYFAARLPEHARVALVPFDAPTGRISNYIFDEMWQRIEDSEKYTMVDRKNLERIDTEIRHQYQTGRVDDASMASITKQYGAQFLIHGLMGLMGNEYRLTIYATDVEAASSSQRAYNIRSDSRLAALLDVTLDEELDRVINVMAKSVNHKTIIAIGRISYGDTQSVSNFSAWLKNSLITGAHKQQDRFQVATERESSDFAVSSRGLTVEKTVMGSGIQAVITGTYSPLDNGAEVTLQMVSTTGNKSVLASQKFSIPASELERRKLNLLPVKGGEVITKAEFETKQKAAASYAGKDNKWNFTVTPDVLDGIYYDGGYMTFQIYSEKDCYFRIIHIDVNGNTQLIYPLAASDNNNIRAGQTRRIPDNTRFRMEAPFGEEMILVSAYERPFTPGQVSGAVNAESITRGLTVIGDNQAAMSPSATARLSYTILPR